MHASKSHHNAHALRPPIGEVGETPLDELSKALCGPDDMALEIEDLAAHFLLEVTQATPSSLPPQQDRPDMARQPLEASLGEACFDGEDGRDGQRAFERLWRAILQRELAAPTDLE